MLKYNPFTNTLDNVRGSAWLSARYLEIGGTNADRTIDIQAQDLVNVGNLGIGTDTPSAKLDVSDGTNSYLTVDPASGKTTIKGKSTYNALGSDLVTNGAFTTDTDWVYGTGWAWNAGGYALHTAGNTETLSQAVSVTSGKTYRVEFEIKNATAGTINVGLNGTYTGAFYKTKDRFAPVLTAGSSGGLVFVPSTDFDGAIDNVVVKEMTANDPAFVLYDEAGNIRSEQRSLDVFSIGKDALKYLAVPNSLNVAIGDGALGKSPDTYRNIAIGTSSAGAQSAGIGYNTAIGVGALANNETGVQNTAIGYNTITLSRASSNNVAIGASALAVYVGGNVDGNKGNNVAIGTQALGNLTTGYNNYGFGTQALYYATTAIGNVALGGIQSVTTGNYNIGIGAVSGNSITTGGSNVCIGAYSGYRLTTQANNTDIGVFAGAGLSGTENTFIGAGAGYSSFTEKTGINYNTVIGRYAGRGMTTNSSSNVFIGYNAGYNESGSNKLYISNNSTTTPLIYGEFTGISAGITIYSQNAAGVPLKIQGAASQSGNHLQIQNSSETVLAGVDERGVVFSNGGTDASNFFAGDNAGKNTATGTNNTSIGTEAGLSLSSGGANTFVGRQAGLFNTTGANNCAFGAEALWSNSTGSSNFAMGYKALRLNTGNSNIGVGVFAAEENTTGQRNLVVGSGSGRYNKTGSDNTIVGQEAGVGASNSSNVSFNTILGSRAGVAIITGADSNTFLGYQAGYGTTTGRGNVSIGTDSGYSVTTGSNNLSIGTSSGNNGTGSNNVAVGESALGNAANKNSNVAIGSKSLISTSGLGNVGIGLNAGYYNSTGGGNVFIGYAVAQGASTYSNASFNVAIGREAGFSIASNSNYNVYLGYKAGYNETGSNKLYIANSDTTTPLIYGLFTGTGAGLTVNSQNAVGVPLTVKGIASQVSSLQEWQNSSGTPLSYITPTGGALFGDKVSFTQTDGNEYIDSLADGYMDYGATTAHRFDRMINQPGIFGELHIHDNTTAQSIASGTTYTKMTAWNDNGLSSNTTPDVSNDKITITKTGIYEVTASISGYSGTANTTFKFSFFLNGVEQDQAHSERKYTVANDIGSTIVHGFIDVTTANWDLDMRCRHDGGGAVNFTMTYGAMTVRYLGET